MKADPTATEKFRRHAIRVEEAQERVLQRVAPLDIERMPLEDAWARRLAEDVFAPHPLPHFRRSGMDGFSVRSDDLCGASPERPVVLRVIEDVPCGRVPRRRIEPGTAARTMTGAPVSEGADAVVRLEMARELMIDGQPHIAVSKPVAPGENVSEIGSEIASGERLLARGTNIRAGETAILAAFGFARVPVFRRPVVAVVSTGEELTDVDAPLAPGKIRNSNAPMLACLIREAGGVPRVLERIGDDGEAVRRAVEQALAEADLVISTGGVSVGDYDVLADMFLSWRGETLFNKIAMRPGSPTTAGVLDGKLIFALSGNPAACFVGFMLLVRPALLAMQGCADGRLAEFRAILEEDYTKTDAYTRFVRGKLRIGDEGRLFVRPVGPDKSSVLSSLKDADCLIRIPAGKRETVKGSLVDVLRFPEE